ncbi:MAG: TolC family protein, partial [Myxococcaceae bacterium]|nr:TolC family protein [Myxococcaceae bacterium]
MWPLLLLSLTAAAPLSFDAALALAEERPEVLGAREAAAARHTLAGRASGALNPTLGVSPGVRWVGTQATVDTSLQLSQGFSLGGLAGARRDALAMETEAALALLSAERRRARQEAARAWLETYAAQEVLALLHAEVHRASDFAATLERAAARGGPTRADVASALSWAAEARLLELDAEGSLFGAGLTLSAAVGAEDATPLSVAGALPDDGGHGAGDGDAEQRLARAQAGAEAARLVELTAQRSPVLTVHASGGREG